MSRRQALLFVVALALFMSAELLARLSASDAGTHLAYVAIGWMLYAICDIALEVSALLKKKLRR